MRTLISGVITGDADPDSETQGDTDAVVAVAEFRRSGVELMGQSRMEEMGMVRCEEVAGSFMVGRERRREV